MFYWNASTGRGFIKNRDKSSKSVFSKRAFWQVKWWYWGDFSSMIRKKIKSFSIDVIGTLLRGTSSKSHVASDFEFFLDTLSCLASVGWRVSKCSEVWSRSKVGHLTCALRFPHTQRVCGIPHTHCEFSVWYFIPHTLSLEFWRVCGTLEIRVCGTIVW